MRRMSQETTKNIIYWGQKGMSSREIAKKVGVGRSSVNRVLRSYLPDKENVKPGRKALISPEQNRRIRRIIQSGQMDNAVQVHRHLVETQQFHGSIETVRNSLRKEGLRARLKTKKPLLTERHKKLRLEYAKLVRDWTLEDWDNIVFTDESKINMYGSDGRHWVWRKPSEKWTERCLEKTIKFGGGNIMVWGCMKGCKLGKLHLITSRLDSQGYVNILQTQFLDSLEMFGATKEEIILQQDNDPKHKSRMAMNWFENNDVIVLDWPPQSPDLNVIENVWGIVKKKLSLFTTEPKNFQELWERSQSVWYNIRESELQEIFDSLPRRIEACIKAKGGSTKY